MKIFKKLIANLAQRLLDSHTLKSLANNKENLERKEQQKLKNKIDLEFQAYLNKMGPSFTIELENQNHCGEQLCYISCCTKPKVVSLNELRGK